MKATMATATIKLYASLARYLPERAQKNTAEIALRPDATISSLCDGLNLPPASCHLVLVNGNFVPPSQRASHHLQDGDTVAVWPPVAGG